MNKKGLGKTVLIMIAYWLAFVYIQVGVGKSHLALLFCFK
jgi:hypothetical protein